MGIFDKPFVTEDMPKGGGSFEPLPAGWYSAVISSADITQTKSGTGRYIKIRYDITGPTHQGRAVFSNLNTENPSAKAEQIGREQLRALLESIGIAKLSDTDQLIGRNVKIKLKIERDEQYGDKNQVTLFAANGSAASPAPAAAAPSAKASGAPPWAR